MTPNRCYDAVLFDLGYTLIHFEPAQDLIVQQALRAAGAERSVAEIQAAVRAVWGAYWQDAATATFPATEEYDREAERGLSRRLLAALGIEGEDMLDRYRAALEIGFDRPGAIRPYPEVREVLAELAARGLRLGVVSNWSWNLRQRVGQAGLDGYFEIVWASAYAGCNKPHPSIFRQALEQIGLPPDRALYVGDSYEHDVVGARNAGLDVVLVDRSAGGNERDCPVIHDLRGLFAFLDEC